MPISASKFFLKDYAVPVSIGIHDFEKARRQTVIINIEMHLENTDVNRNDNIENTINYDFLRSEIEVLVKDRHFNLQETLCYEIVKICKAKQLFSKIVVSTSKPDIYKDCNTVGFELIFEK
ncbi:MAG: hypothetical protein CMM41_05515 [Rhodospirillaceae bacterium]|nr:hypothetical protein [Rhodospirillaceae bacterium]MBC26652.1 hypothetical protein [Rhodospirillaceae bacterium]|tara:strand:- start:198 stop:560 length:363 start_codon:yes stop_codon:yes gene_type:complete